MMGVHAMEQVAQLIFGLVSVSQVRPRMVSDAASRGVTRNHVDTHGTPLVLDSVSSANCVMDLACKVPSNKWRVIGVGCNRTGSSIVNLQAILFIACFKLAPSFFSNSLYKHLLLMGLV